MLHTLAASYWHVSLVVHGYKCWCLFILFHFCTDVASFPGPSGEGPGDEASPDDEWNKRSVKVFSTLSWKQRPFLSFRPWQCMAMGKETETMQALQGQNTKHTHCSQAHINQDVILCQSGQVFQLRVSILIQQRANYFLGQTRNVRSRLQKE